jgi:transcriptional regulator with XRE-family HTH domain
MDTDNSNGIEATTALPAANELGRKIGRLRRERRLTGHELGGQVEMSQAKISRIETGAVVPTPAELKRLATALEAAPDVIADLFSTADALRSSALGRRSPQRGALGQRGQPPGGMLGQQEYSVEEVKARQIRSFEPIVVPGLLQIGEYTWRILHGYLEAALGSSEDRRAEIAAIVTLRTKRQELLYSPDKTFEFVIMESVLRNRFTAPGYMLAQIERLEGAATLPNVTIRVVSDLAELVFPPVTGFTLLDDEVVVTESMHAQWSRDRKSVDFYRRLFDAYVASRETDLAPILQRYKVRYADLARPQVASST